MRGGSPTPTIRSNDTDYTDTSSLIVYGGAYNLIHKIQTTFSGLSKTVTDPDIAACFYQLSNTWGYLKQRAVFYITGVAM